MEILGYLRMVVLSLSDTVVFFSFFPEAPGRHRYGLLPRILVPTPCQFPSIGGYQQHSSLPPPELNFPLFKFLRLPRSPFHVDDFGSATFPRVFFGSKFPRTLQL